MPAVQYGDVADVKKRMRSIVKRLMRGEDLIDVMTEGGMLDVAEHPGLLVLNGTVLSGAPHFHCGLPWMPLWQALFGRRVQADPALNEAIFEASLGVPWGVLGLLPHENHPWLIPETRFEPFIEAALRVWDELDAVGPRYYAAVEGKRFTHSRGNIIVKLDLEPSIRELRGNAKLTTQRFNVSTESTQSDIVTSLDLRHGRLPNAQPGSQCDLRNPSLLSKFLQHMHSLRHGGLSRSNERCDAIRDGFFVL